MHLAAHVAALIAVLSTGVVYGADAFCALVRDYGPGPYSQ
jgi:hypothetical protein